MKLEETPLYKGFIESINGGMPLFVNDNSGFVMDSILPTLNNVRYIDVNSILSTEENFDTNNIYVFTGINEANPETIKNLYKFMGIAYYFRKESKIIVIGSFDKVPAYFLSGMRTVNIQNYGVEDSYYYHKTR